MYALFDKTQHTYQHEHIRYICIEIVVTELDRWNSPFLKSSKNFENVLILIKFSSKKKRMEKFIWTANSFRQTKCFIVKTKKQLSTVKKTLYQQSRIFQ